jgi:P27 family predicted phage terminase small subunit
MPAHKKPTSLALLHGDHKTNPSRVNRNEPKPSAREVIPPDDLSEEALAVWYRLADDLISVGVLTHWDIEAYAEYCESVVDLREARAALREQPMVIGARLNPWARARNEAHRRFLDGCGKFGLTPSDRANIRMDNKPTGDDSDLLSG